MKKHKLLVSYYIGHNFNYLNLAKSFFFRCVDDDGLLLDDKPLGRVADINTLSNGIVLSDRELMPPPNVLPIRVLTATAFVDNKRNSPSTSLLSPSKINNNNGEQRHSTV